VSARTGDPGCAMVRGVRARVLDLARRHAGFPAIELALGLDGWRWGCHRLAVQTDMKGTKMTAKRVFLLGGLALLAVSAAAQQAAKPASPSGTAAAEVGGTWEKNARGRQQYTGGKWVEIEYGRPILRGRKDIFGAGADYGKQLNAGAPIWRAGANATTKLTTEVPLVIGGKTLQPGSYDVFVELKESGWTFVLGTQKTQAQYDENEKTAIWGAYGYDSKFDVVRAPMTMAKLNHSIDQFTISFLDVTNTGGKIGMAWDKTSATVDFTLGH
jgi:Protein of unknown function (DUF2911)